MQLNEIIDQLKTIYKQYNNIKLGIAGSYANGTQDSTSDIDIVIDGDSTQIDLIQHIKSLFSQSVDILWVDLMEKEDRDLDELAKANDLPINKYSVYKTVMKEVIWI